MNRRDFLKTLGGVAVVVALPAVLENPKCETHMDITALSVV